MLWLRRCGIAFKLSLMVLSGVTLVITLILALNYNVTRRLMVEKIEANAFNLSQATANHINNILKAAEKIPAGIAPTVTELNPDDDKLKDLLRKRLQQNPELFGIAAAFEPATSLSDLYPATTPGSDLNSETKLYSRYFIRSGNRIKQSPINYDYRTHDWYQIPEVLGRLGTD